jgi:type II secretory pathway component PulC
MRKHILGLGTILLIACSVPAYAGPLQLKAVPAEAKWVAHIDVDAMRSSEVIQRFYDECIKGRAPAGFLDIVVQQCGLDLRKDLHHVTMYSTKIADGHGVLVVKAKMDEAKLLAKAKKAPNHRSMTYRDYEIHTWTHRKPGKERQFAGAFQDEGVLVFASSVELLKSALDVLDGRSDSLHGTDTPLAEKVPAGTMFLARAAGISSSQAGDRHPLCSQLDRLDCAEGQDQGKWFGHLTMDAADEDAAQRIETVIEGLLAMCWLHLDSVPELQRLLDQVEVSRKGSVVRADFEAPVEKVVKAVSPTCELLRQCLGQGTAVTEKKPVDKPRGKNEPAKKAREDGKKQAEAETSGEDAEPRKAPAKDRETQAKKPEPKRESTTREGTPVLGIVIGEPLRGESPEIIRVWPDGPAEKGGLQAGDVIVKFDDQPIDSPQALRDAVVKQQPGDRVNLTVRRDGRQEQIKVRLAGADDFAGWGRREQARQQERLPRLLSPRPWLGVRVATGTGRGVSVEGVIPGGPADRAGLKEGDAIIRVEKTRVEAPADLQAAVAGYRPGETIRLVVNRGDSRQKIKVALGAFGTWEGESEEPVRELLRRLLEGRSPYSEGS